MSSSKVKQTIPWNVYQSCLLKSHAISMSMSTLSYSYCSEENMHQLGSNNGCHYSISTQWREPFVPPAWCTPIALPVYWPDMVSVCHTLVTLVPTFQYMLLTYGHYCYCSNMQQTDTAAGSSTQVAQASHQDEFVRFVTGTSVC